MAFTEQFSFPVVNANALQIYKIALSNWGNEGVSKDKNSVVSPVFPFSLAGLAIDPESLVTSVIVRPVKGGVLDPSGVSMPDDFVIDKNLPFTGRLTFPKRGPYSGTWGLVAFSGDRFGDTMVGQDGNLANFGGAVPEFVKPDLRALLYVDGAPPPAGVPLRAPRRVSFGVTAAGPVTITIQPISGRRFIRVTCAPIAGLPGGNGHTYQFRGITSRGTGPGLYNSEFAALTPNLITGTVGAAGSVKSALITEPSCSWLHVVATANSAGAASTLVIDMYD